MRVLLLIHNLDLGGAQSAVLHLARGLAGLGAWPLVMPWRRAGVLTPRFREAGIALALPESEPRGWARLGVPGLIRAKAAEHRINVIHAHMSDSALWAAWLRRGGGPPAVVTHHSSGLIDTVGRGRPVYGWLRRRLLFASARRVSANIAVSEAVRAPLAAQAGIPAEDIRVIPNGIELPPEAEVTAAVAARRARADAGEAPRLLFLGRLAESKGLDVLIAAAPLVLEAFPGAVIELIGEGEQAAALAAQVEALGLAQAVRFRGFAADVGPWLADADLLVSPSRVEGLPLAVLEAMAWGLPTVASDIPAHRALIRQAESGALVPLDSPAALAEGLIAALREHAMGLDRAERARALVAKDYSEAAMARRHLALYRSLVGESDVN